MRPGLPGGKVMTQKRVPFGGGGVPRMRAPRSSTVSPIGISAGAPSVIQIRVDWAPERAAFVVGRRSVHDRFGDVALVVAGHHAPDR